MFKMITLIARKPGISREEFVDYYENHHAPLALKLFPQIKKYTRNYPTGDNIHYAGVEYGAQLPYDVVTEHWFENQAAYDDMMQSFATNPDKFKALAQDEDNFLDKTKIVMFLVQEKHSDI